MIIAKTICVWIELWRSSSICQKTTQCAASYLFQRHFENIYSILWFWFTAGSGLFPSHPACKRETDAERMDHRFTSFQFDGDVQIFWPKGEECIYIFWHSAIRCTGIMIHLNFCRRCGKFHSNKSLAAIKAGKYHPKKLWCDESAAKAQGAIGVWFQVLDKRGKIF